MAAKVLIIVPCFNEENNIQMVIDEISSSIPDVDILVINDCSTDKTTVAARDDGRAKVVDLPINLGIGGAVQTGFKYADRKGYDIAVQLDGDGQHIAKEVNKLINIMEITGSDMAIGSRFLDIVSFRTTASRRAGIKCFEFMYKVLLKKGISDGTSGFRAYNRECIKYLSEFYPDDYPEPEAVIMISKQGFKIVEVGVGMRERAHGTSSITPVKSMYYMIKVVVSMLFSYIRE